MRYQQKQREEMERKRNEYIGSRGGRIPALELNSESNKIQIGNGKVCIPYSICLNIKIFV